jgi:hypothetical protein
MRAQTVLQKMQSKLDRVASLGVESLHGVRRLSHGGSAWSLPRGTSSLRQPQDGASLAGMLSQLEPEDAGMTGGTRSLSRRLMGLNVTAAPRKRAAAVMPPVATRQVA